MKRLIPFMVVILLCGSLYSQDIQSVTVYYTANGVSRSESVSAGTTRSISRDQGTPINIRIYKTASAPTSSTFTIACFPSGISYEKTSTNSSEYFSNVGDALTNDIWCMVNAVLGTVRIQPVDIPTSYPDLSPITRQVGGYATPGGRVFYVGQTVDLECDIWNSGSVAAGSSRVGFYIGTSTSDYSDFIDYNSTGTLAPGYAEHEKDSYTFSTSDIGTRYINFWADYQNVVNEGSAETNNKQTWGPFTVSHSPLTIDLTQPSSNLTVTQGQTVSIAWTGGGSDAIMVSLRRDNDNIWENGTGETWIALSQPISGSYSWNTADVPPGTYYIAGAIFNSSTFSYDYAAGRVTVSPLCTITGSVSSDLNSFDKIPGALITIDGNPAFQATTDNSGNYTISNISSGEHQVTISHNGYWWEGNNSTSYTRTVTIAGDQEVNFVGHCIAFPEITYSVPSIFTPGSPIDISVTLKNTSYAVSGVPAYLDISFPDFTSPTSAVTVIGQSGFDDNPQLYQPGTSICRVNASTGEMDCNFPAEWLLVSAVRTSTIYFNSEWTYTLRITPPEVTNFRIWLKGSIGDQRWPNSGIEGQQGYFEEELIISTNLDVPMNWELINEIDYTDFFGNDLKIQDYTDGNNDYPVIRINNQITLDREVAEFIYLWHLSMQYNYLDFNNQDKIDFWNNYSTSMLSQVDFHTAQASEYWEKRVEKAEIGSIPKRVGYWGTISAGAASGAAVGAGIGILGGVTVVPAAIIGGAFGFVTSNIGYAYHWFAEDVLSVPVDYLGDQYFDKEYPNYFAANEWLKSKGITSEEELTYEAFKRLMNEYSNIYEVGQKLATFVDYSLIALNIGISMFDEDAALSFAGVLAEEMLEKILIDNGTFFANVTTDRNADLYIYWAENSQRNHAMMLNRLALVLASKYGILDDNLISNSLNGNLGLLHDIILLNMFIKSNELERDYSLALRTHQISKKESYIKQTLFNTAIQEEAERSREILTRTIGEFEALKAKQDALLANISNFDEKLNEAYIEIIGNTNSKHLVYDNASSNISPVQINSTGQVTLAIRNIFSEDIDQVDVNVVDPGGFSIESLTQPQIIRAGNVGNFIFNLVPTSNMTEEVSTLKFEIITANSDPRCFSSFTVDIQSVLPYGIVRMSSEKDVYNQGESVKLYININSSISTNEDLLVKLYVYDQIIASELVQNISLSDESPSYISVSIPLPMGCPNGQYGIKAEFNRFNLGDLSYEVPRLFWVQPTTIDGDFSTFDFTSISIVSSLTDFEIAERINIALENSQILYSEGLTAGDLLDAMLYDNLILIGGDEVNLAVEDLVYRGKIQSNLWSNPGDAHIIAVNDPFTPVAPAGNKAIVIAGYNLEDTFVAGLKFLSELDKMDSPRVSDVLINPSMPHNTSNLSLTYQYFDPDGDPESGTIIQWYKNNIHQSSLDGLITVSSDLTSVGDTWYVTVMPSDGLVFGEQVTSNTVTISLVPQTWYVSTTGSDVNGAGTEINPYATIQHALSQSGAFDTIWVSSGTYYGNFYLKNNVYLKGENNVNTILIGRNYTGGVVQFRNQTNCIIDGFTITKDDLTPSDRAVVFYENCNNTNIIKNCIIYGLRYGIIVDAPSKPLIYNNTLDGGGTCEGGIYNGYETTGMTVINNIVTGYTGVGVYCWGAETIEMPTIQYNNIWGNGHDYYMKLAGYKDNFGNISENPSFIDATNHNYSLQPYSLCINSGDPSFPADSHGSQPEMGALPYNSGLPAIRTISVQSISPTNAEGGGNILESIISPVITKGLCWSTEPNPTIELPTKTTDGDGLGYYSSTITGLSSGTTYFLRAYATNGIGTAYGNEVSFKTYNSDAAQDVEGNYYNIITLGSQTWMAENLRYLPAVSPPESGSLTEPLYYVYGYSGSVVSEAKATTNYNTFGVLYNWPAAMIGCPDGWKLPSDEDWKLLEIHLGMSMEAADQVGTRGTDEGSKLAGYSDLWLNGVLINNSAFGLSGFNAVPGGNRGNGGIGGLGNSAFWWTSTPCGPDTPWWRHLYYTEDGIIRDGYPFTYDHAFSVRCLKEQEVLSTVSTGRITNITPLSAICGGVVSDDGGSSIEDRGFCYSKDPTPDLEDLTVSAGTGTGDFSATLTNLEPGTIYYVRAYAANNSGISYGDDVVFATYNADAVQDIDGNYYNQIAVGSQVWLGENLRTTKLNDETEIPPVTDDNQWAALSTPGYCWYDNDETSNKHVYGALYNWYTVNTGNLCPTGWHVPSDEEWSTLESYLILNGFNYDGTTTGNKIAKSVAATTLWETSAVIGAVGNTDYHEKRNSSLLSALPAGLRGGTGLFQSEGSQAWFWTSLSANTSSGWDRALYTNSVETMRGYTIKTCGFSVRCIKDANVPSVETSNLNSITITTAHSGGNVTNDGGSPVTLKGVCWSTSQEPTIDLETKTIEGTGTGEFSSVVSGLLPGTTYYLRAYATNGIGTGYGEEVSFRTYNSDAIQDIDGNYYDIITLGSQVWMKENLKVTKYNDGIPVPNVTDDNEWNGLSTPAYCWYHNDRITYGETYGALYNWYAVSPLTNGARNVCPTGWHVPSDLEWHELALFIDPEAVLEENVIESHNGYKLKEAGTIHWLEPNEGATNESGFTSLAAGTREDRIYGGYDPNSNFEGLLIGACFWTATEYNSDIAWYRNLGFNSADLGRHNGPNQSKRFGYSIRCIKDNTTEQSVDLTEGWNLISFAALPSDMTAISIVDPLISSNLFVKLQDESGRAVEHLSDPIGWINEIGQMSVTEGYKIRVEGPVSLTVTGQQASLPIDIPLETGWNLIGYPSMTSQSASSFFGQLISAGSLLKVQNEYGSSIEQIEGEWIYGFENLTPGEGYRVKTGFNTTLTVAGGLKGSMAATERRTTVPVHFRPSYTGNGLDHMNIFIEKPERGKSEVSMGDEIAIYDGDLCVGAVVVNDEAGKYFGVIASLDDPVTSIKDGFTEGSAISLRFWDVESGDEKILEKIEVRKGKGLLFERMGTLVLKSEFEVLRGSFLGEAYPNPSDKKTTFTFSLADDCRVRFEILDLKGSVIRILVDETLLNGIYEIEWDNKTTSGQNVMEGLYLYRLLTNQGVQTKQLVIR